MHILPDEASQFDKNGVYYEKNVTDYLHKTLKKHSVLYDIGANYGYYSHEFSNICKQVYAFEPVSSTFDVLKMNVGCRENVQCFNIGLLDEEGTRQIHIYTNSGCNSITRRTVLPTVRKEDILVKRLDDVILEEGLLPPDVMKIDVEGVEKLILQGSCQTLTKYRPILILEFANSTYNDAGYTTNDMINFLQSYNYDIKGFMGHNDIYQYELKDFNNNITDIIAVSKGENA